MILRNILSDHGQLDQLLRVEELYSEHELFTPLPSPSLSPL